MVSLFRLPDYAVDFQKPTAFFCPFSGKEIFRWQYLRIEKTRDDTAVMYHHLSSISACSYTVA